MATESVLEQQRKLHEERERLEDALVKERILKKPSVCIPIGAHHHHYVHPFSSAGQGPDKL